MISTKIGGSNQSSRPLSLSKDLAAPLHSGHVKSLNLQELEGCEVHSAKFVREVLDAPGRAKGIHDFLPLR